MAERRRGFTLIELLTVIAIISILAGLIAVGAPQVLRKARLASVDGTMKQIGNSLAAYFADHGSYPPGYGYLRFNGGGALTGPQSAWILPWHAILGIYDPNVYTDVFSNSGDMNRNGTIDLLEYMPIGNAQNQFPADLFTGEPAGGALAANVNQQRVNQRAFLYVPVNLEDFKKVESYFSVTDNYVQRQKGLVWNQADPRLAAIFTRSNPAPPRYDAYVLVSVGPTQDGGSIVAGPPAGSGVNPYYAAGLITYFRATRDANNNGQADYDFRSRTGGGKDKNAASFSDPNLQTFPDGTNGQGPVIFRSQ